MAVPQSFPAKIYQILENESPEIIQWNENGSSFRILDHGRFEREIVPKYFRHNQISSVQRQLNLYGFKCISRGEYKRSFFHPKFRRGEWETVKKLTRYIPVKRTSQGSDRNPTKPDATLIGSNEQTSEPPPPGTQMYLPFMYPFHHAMPPIHPTDRSMSEMHAAALAYAHMSHQNGHSTAGTSSSHQGGSSASYQGAYPNGYPSAYPSGYPAAYASGYPGGYPAGSGWGPAPLMEFKDGQPNAVNMAAYGGVPGNHPVPPGAVMPHTMPYLTRHQQHPSADHSSSSSSSTARMSYAPLPSAEVAARQVMMLNQAPTGNAEQSPKSTHSSPPAPSSSQNSIASIRNAVAQQSTHTSSSNCNSSSGNVGCGSGANVNPDYDMMVEFGVFDNFQLPDAMTPVLAVAPKPQLGVEEVKTFQVPVVAPTDGSVSSHLMGSTASSLSSNPPDKSTTRLVAVSAALRCSDHPTDEKQSREAACNTELTFDAATGSFVRRRG